MSRAALLVLAAAWAATLWLAPFSDERVNDLFVYREFAAPVLGGALPYREVFFEYPPLAVPAIALPGLLGTAEEVFRAAFAGWTLLLAAAAVLLCGALAARTGGRRPWALLTAAAMPLLLGALVRTHFDLAPVVLMLAALALLLDRRPRLGMAVLGLAAMTKGFPLAAAPVALVWLWRSGVGSRRVWQATAALLAALVAPALAVLAVSPSGALEAVEYHVERPVQVESVPAMGVLLLDALGAGEAESVQSHRSDGLEHPAAAVLAGVSALLMLVAIAVAGARTRGDPRDLVLGALAAVLAFAALGKVLSPQYMLWLVPLAALAVAWRTHALAAALIAAAILTQAEFPARYFDLVQGEPLAIALVALRNLALIAALLLALRELGRSGQQQLLDRDGEAARVPLHDHRVEPRILV
ncbi:MAG: glycosyltransferase 87 family protein [Thermoleophilaceae bacterium]